MAHGRPLTLMLAVRFGTSEVKDGLLDTVTSISPAQAPTNTPVWPIEAAAGSAGVRVNPKVVAVTSASSSLRMSSQPPAHRSCQVRPPSAEHWSPPDTGDATMEPLGRTVTAFAPFVKDVPCPTGCHVLPPSPELNKPW